MPKVRFDRFYRYEELTRILRAWAKEKPRLLKLSSIGKSYEKRNIWLATITNFDTGVDREKPALWVEANIHSTEVTGSSAALHLIHRLLTQYGRDPKTTAALDTRVFYVVPRLNPDGAELALAEQPRIVRSSVRPYPLPDSQDGLHVEDIDGDGRILTMRIPDRNGPWKAHPKEKRLMVRREPDEFSDDGIFYRLLPEGTIQNYDGVLIKMAPPQYGLDLNRNFPAEWAPENEQRGAGLYPTSEPEIRAEVQAIVERPNVCGYISYHTNAGVHLRPFSSHSDDHFPTADLRTYKFIGEEATKITGYPVVSIFHGFRQDPKRGISGVSVDWPYDHLGIYAWTTEFWAPMREAGIDYRITEWRWDHPVEDDIKLLRWNDRALDGKAFVRWYPFEHPQLGPVELGGWDFLHYWGNVPRHLLEKEIAPHSEFAILHALISPRLELHSLNVERVNANTYRVLLALQNTGWLPTYVTQKAQDRKAVRPIEVEITVPRGARVVGGEPKVEVGQLEGRALKRNPVGFGDDLTTDRAKLEWVIEAPRGGRVKIEARHQRAGVLRTLVTLE